MVISCLASYHHFHLSHRDGGIEPAVRIQPAGNVTFAACYSKSRIVKSAVIRFMLPLCFVRKSGNASG